jgi:hypothetical protein
MKRETLDTTHFVGIFNNRRVRSGANIGTFVEVKSEDGLEA